MWGCIFAILCLRYILDLSARASGLPTECQLCNHDASGRSLKFEPEKKISAKACGVHPLDSHLTSAKLHVVGTERLQFGQFDVLVNREHELQPRIFRSYPEMQRNI